MNVISPHLPPHLASHITPSDYNPFDVVESAIANAFDSLKFNQSVADTVAAHLIQLTPDLNGNVHDETPGRVDRVQLAGRATTFNGSNQYFSSNVSISSGLVELSFSAWVRTTDTDEVLTQYETVGDHRSFRINIENAGTVQAVISGDGTYDATATKRANTVATFDDGEWHHIVVTWSAASDEMKIFVDGKKQTLVVNADASIATVYTSSTPILVGARASSGSGVALLDGQIQLPCIWYSELTAVQVRDLYLEEYSKVTKPDLVWLLDGANGWSLVGGDHLTPAGDPTLYQDAEVPVRWLNTQGWNSTIYKSDFSSGRDGWAANAGSSTVEIVEFEGEENVVKFTMGDDGDGTGSSDRAERTFDVDHFVNGENYTLKFDLYIPSSNAGMDRVRSAASLLVTSDVQPTLDSWETVTLTGLSANTSYPKLRIYARDGSSYTVPAGDVFYITNIEIISEFVSGGGVVPKQWGADLDANGNGPDDSNSFGEAKCEGQLIDGPCINLAGSNQGGVITNTHDYSSEDWEFEMYYSCDSITGTRILFGQTKTEGSATNTWLRTASSTGVWNSVLPDSTTNFDDITAAAVGKSYFIKLLHDATAQTLELQVTNLTDKTPMQSQIKTGIDAASETGDLTVGRNHNATTVMDGRVYGLKLTCSTDATKSFQIPVSEESGLVSYDVSGNRKHVTWSSSVTWGLQDHFFWSDNKGCSAVPIFEDGIELVNGNVDYEGLKKAAVELHLFLTDGSAQTIFTNGSVGPFRVRVSGSKIQVQARNIDNASTVQAQFNITTNTHYKIHVELIEHPTDPRNQSSCVITDLVTGNVLAQAFDCDFSLSAASTNSGNQQIGSYTNAAQSFTGDIYLVKHWANDVLKCDWVANDYLSNAAPSNAGFTETGGTLDIKKIPAQTTDPSKDVNGYELNMKAGPHINSQASLKICNVDESPSTAERFYGASFNGTSSVIEYDAENFDWSHVLDFGFDAKATNVGTQALLYSQSNGNYAASITSGRPRVKINGSFLTHSTAASSSAMNTFSFDYAGGLTGEMGVTLNGVRESQNNDAASVTQNVKFQIGETNGGGSRFTGEMRNIYVKENGVTLLDSPHYRNSLDWSDALNHGDDVDITYLSETEFFVQLADAVTNTHYHERDSLGRITKSIAIAG